MEAELYRLLEQYHHFLYMTRGPYRARKMSLYGFKEWLYSRRD